MLTPTKTNKHTRTHTRTHTKAPPTQSLSQQRNHGERRGTNEKQARHDAHVSI